MNNQQETKVYQKYKYDPFEGGKKNLVILRDYT